MSAWENHHLEWSPDPLSGIVTMNSNPYFESSTSPWTSLNNAILTRSSAQAHESRYSMLVTPDGVTAVPGAVSDQVPVLAGHTYAVSAWLWSTAAATRRIAISWWDASHGFLSNSLVSASLAAGTWTQIGPTSFTPPAGAAFASITTSDPGTPAASNPWFIDEALLYDVASVPTNWLDITPFALSQAGGVPIIVTIGAPAGMGSASQPATMGVSLDNTDHRFTFGNTNSPLWPNWKPGRRIRHYETINGRRFDEFSGFIQPPETEDWAEQGNDQTVTITAVDRLGWMSRGRKFVSTLAEHIFVNAGPALKAYWTLGDRGQPPFLPIAGSSAAPLLPLLSNSTAGAATTGQATITPASGTVAAGDDLPCAKFTVSTTVGGAPGASWQLYTTNLSPTVTLAAGQVLTAVIWLSIDALTLPGSLYEVFSIDLLENLGVSHLAMFYDSSAVSSGIWGADIGLGGLSGSISSNLPVGLNQPISMAVRYGYSPSVFEFWIGTRRLTGALTGVAPTSTQVIQLVAPTVSYSGLYGHVQLYVGAPNDWDYTKYQAQAGIGTTGLAGQTTGQRITTLAQYAGVPTTELSLIDPGTAQMQKAALAGKDPVTAMREAETTEQGRLRTNGQGLLVFDPRTRRYNS